LVFFEKKMAKHLETSFQFQVFIETKDAVDRLEDFLWNHEIPTTAIHGDRDQRMREAALEAFRSGSNPVRNSEYIALEA
jgi:ATP-dependent RNA helicase DDX3X